MSYAKTSKRDTKIQMSAGREAVNSTWWDKAMSFFYHPSPPDHLNITWYNLFLHEGMASLIFQLAIALPIAIGVFSKGSLAFVHGLALYVALSFFSSFGAGFVNPHTTLVKFFMGKLPGQWWHLFIVLIAQGVGSLFSVVITLYSVPDQDTSGGLGVPVKSAAISNGYALLMEATGTFFLVLLDVLITDFVQRAVAGAAYLTYLAKTNGGNQDSINVQRYNNALYGGGVTQVFRLALGALLALLVFMFFEQTGASFNFWRWFIPAMWSGVSRDDWYIYVVGPILGAFVAWLVACLVLFLADHSQSNNSPETDRTYIKNVERWWTNKKEKAL